MAVAGITKALLKTLSKEAKNINVKIAKDLGFSGKKITKIPFPVAKVDWRHKKAPKYRQTYEVQKGTPAKQDKIAEEARVVIHDLSERLGFSPDKLNDVQYGKIYALMKKAGHKDSLDGRPFSKEKVGGGFKNLNIFGKSTGYGTAQRLTATGEKVSEAEKQARKQFTSFFARGYDVDDLGASPLARYQRMFSPEAYYKLRQPFVDLQMKSKDLSKKYQDRIFNALDGENKLAELLPEEYDKFIDVGKDLKLLMKIDPTAARKISNFMMQFKMSVAHAFPADFVKTQKGKGIQSLATRFVSKPNENLYIHPGYLNYKLSPFEHNAALKYQAGLDPRKTAEAEAIEQLGGYMKFPSGEEIGMHPLKKYGDYDRAIEEAIKLIEKNKWMKAGKPPYYAKGGTVKGYAGGGIARLGAKLLQKLVGKLSNKELQMILDSSFKGTKPSTSPKRIRQMKLAKYLNEKYGKETTWPYVKSKVPGPKVGE